MATLTKGLDQLADTTAIDDIDRDSRSPAATDEWQPLTFDFSSAEAF